MSGAQALGSNQRREAATPGPKPSSTLGALVSPRGNGRLPRTPRAAGRVNAPCGQARQGAWWPEELPLAEWVPQGAQQQHQRAAACWASRAGGFPVHGHDHAHFTDEGTEPQTWSSRRSAASAELGEAPSLPARATPLPVAHLGSPRGGTWGLSTRKAEGGAWLRVYTCTASLRLFMVLSPAGRLVCGLHSASEFLLPSIGSGT